MNTFARHSASALLATGVILGGCSQPSNSDNVQAVTAKPATSTGPITAKTALSPLYKSALKWSSDIQLMRLAPKSIDGYPNEAGKAAVWQATFASSARHQFRIYTYSTVTVPPDTHQGIDSSIAQEWRGVDANALPVDLTLFTADSDAAYAAAQRAASAWLSKNPGKPITSFALGSNGAFRAPTWYIQWGDKKSGYVTLVDASTGTVFKSK